MSLPNDDAVVSLEQTDALHNAIPPVEKYKPETTMKLLAKEMNDLAVTKRQQVFEEIHGVSQVNRHEDPALVSKSLEQFDFELSKQLLQDEWPAYHLAHQKDETFVNSYKFRIMFLRAEKFEVRAAVKRSLLFLERKLEWFGPEKIVKEIELSDMNKDDMETINSGGILHLPTRDRSGRLIMWDFQRYRKCKTKENVMRWSMYLMTSMMHDEESQKSGIVGVIWQPRNDLFSSLNEKINRDLNWEGCRFLQCMPARLAAFHLCVSDPRIKPIATLILQGAGREVRARSKIHEGTDLENLYALMTFGIPAQVAPLDMNGALKLKHHKQWLQKRKKKEKNPQLYNNPNKNLIFYDIPSNYDVLLGKGKPIQDHYGNVLLHELVDSYWERYHFQSNRIEKRNIMEEIVQKVHNTPGKFLQRDENGWWYEAPLEMAIQKVGARFRTATPPLSSSTNRDKASTPQQNNNDEEKNDTAGVQQVCCGGASSKRPRLWQDTTPSGDL